MKYLSSIALLLTCMISSAQALEYNAPTLIFNSSADSGHNMPPRTVFTDRAPSINDHGEMAITLTLLDGTYDTGIWVKSKFQEGILTTTGARESFNDVQINNDGALFYTHQTLNGIKGVYTATGKKEGGYNFTNHMDDEEIMPYESFSNLFLTKSGELFFTAKNFKGDLAIFNYHAEFGLDLITAQNQRSRTPYSFVFSPSYNDNSEAAYKVRVGKRGELDDSLPDQIILSKGSSKKIVAQDQDSDPNSKWKSLRNTVALSNSGAVAFIAHDGVAEKLVLIEANGNERILATKGKELKEFSFFSVIINDKNWVAFRGKDLEGNHTIFIATENGVQKVLTQFDKIKVPWGEALIAYGPHIPFGGNIDMNNHGDIIVNTGLANLENTQDYGSGVVVIYSKK
ncbi:putative exported protein [Halobacteriovorax marinus SJ]|uniref:Exported protein n=1 Tax=Halobacteriovorax marinus (strain ATCC BAA-682 / DSM 15412 / SJ) TaxID=862908 RepID=E1X5G4_HALMS|nr:hypothetical protein [Halobacteriovorax marinus]CBW27285.1 putative exported protein [Halobacteriovorax marinus SJ]